ncbi:stage V sporulation protein SpoVM [Bhargavaea ginsengi]|nr:stage V sporulation protein SpoVM [Bhargavaea ginsengi]MCM3087380.1 stage V sporulation protein SpoVM [Bhargavaea ginsengi]
MRVYTFQLPKMVSSFARKCLQLFQREEQKTAVKKKKRRKSKMPS